MSQPVVHIANLNLKYQQKPVLQDLNWTINRYENWLLCGTSGSGKTSLAKAIAGVDHSYGNIKIEFNAQSNLPATVYYVANWFQFKDLEGQSNFYYQQRYNKQSTETTATVKAELESFGKKNALQFNEVDSILAALGFSELKHSTLIQLSSGEHKKLQLVKAIWLKPQLLILDLPYNGLDTLSRQNLNTLLEEISEAGTQLILISNDEELPSCLNRFAVIKEGQLVEISADERTGNEFDTLDQAVPAFLAEATVASSSAEIIKMIDVNVSYGDKRVLKNINWEVKAGEKWVLQGHNGSGKSTLLSLICGDHPQAYANNFHLFGNKRGSGESIWEIKERIGLISPELHWYFDPSATVFQSIMSGFYDSSGLFCDPGYSKKIQTDELVSYFGLDEYKNTLMNELPLGKQRLALLARTIVKNPELLILDEPCQGLDQQQTKHFNRLVDGLCKNGTTLIYVGHFESQLPACIEKRILLENGAVKSVENILENVENEASIENVENFEY
ncbi:molybdate transport system ATP-binding protein [Pedobacter sp. ok626]|uniref:ATP-binding cassette domain-containing protein n=1 Tax=Pedobacter sp. ok626 TaxID=1761882 RepID=UPI00087E283C|nr:ATP-binding cassette domain-containing protein [Pedobacter sp. ok626]SDL71789.1 molybdate transport system ATP-binding protein [Pedobacter sp. ok626]